MKPPICCICGKDFRDLEGGGLVYFKKQPSDEEWVKMMDEKNMAGHPPFAEWFCDKHYLKAKELQDLTIDNALDMMKKS